MKKSLLLLAVFIVFTVNLNAQGVKFLIGSSYAKIGENDQKYITGNSQFSLSVGAFYDQKIKGKLFISPELLFTNNVVTYSQKYVLTNNIGEAYDYILNHKPISMYGLEIPLQIKLKGDVAYLSTGVNPYINNYKFDTFYSISTGLVIAKKFSMDLRYSLGLINQVEGYKTERVTVGFSYLIRN